MWELPQGPAQKTLRAGIWSLYLRVATGNGSRQGQGSGLETWGLWLTPEGGSAFPRCLTQVSHSLQLPLQATQLL